MADTEPAVDINRVPLPGMYWALWDADGELLSYVKTPERVHPDWVLHALRYTVHTRATLAEFTAEKWGRFLVAVANGEPTGFETWKP